MATSSTVPAKTELGRGRSDRLYQPHQPRPLLLNRWRKSGTWMTLRAIAAAWAALAVVLTGATELRPGLPVGPGELLLAGWILLVGSLLLRRGIVGLGPIFRVLLLYWLLAFALLGLGAVVASATAHQDGETARHDTVAFALAAVVSCLFALRWGDDNAECFHLLLARYTFFICAATTTTLLIVAQHVPAIGSVRLWYSGVRFAGWAQNPNQMALFAVTMPFLGWYLMQHSHGLWRKVIYLAGILGATAVGLASQSDALRIAWVVTLSTIGMILWWRSIARGRGRFLFVPYILVPFAVVYLGAVFGDDLALKLDQEIQRMYAEGDQGEARFRLWSHGMAAIVESPLFGFGPGAHSGMTGPFEGSEAHNSLIDWGMSTGMAGILLHLALLAWCALRALRAGLFSLFAIVQSLAAFSLFNYSLRQPIYWLMLILVLTLTEGRRQVSAAQRPTNPGPVDPKAAAAAGGEIGGASLTLPRAARSARRRSQQRVTMAP